jgi:hypothetical protein
MSANKTAKTLADYVAIAISPVLIMALVGSLVFFLVAVLYVGDYAGRLCWILFFFVFGAVLIARMTMQGETADRAGLYGLVLGLLVWVALLIYVDWKNSGALAPFGWLLDIGLIAITWWSAHRLTWDCTLIDDDVDASGTGLLQAAGLEGKTAPTPDDAGQDPIDNDRHGKKFTGLAGWWERYRRYREERKKRPHTPGVWVVYFSLAALPLFGIGQAILSASPAHSTEDLARLRGYTFWLMTIYVGSGLGLLVTTSFLGLRRYLRQRKLQMPAAMTGVWLLVGGLLIAAFLVVGGLLPRPESARRLAEWVAALTSQKRDASEADLLGNDPGEGEGREGNEQPRGRAREKDGAGEDKNERARDQEPQKDGKEDRKDGKAKGQDGKGNSKDGKESGRDAKNGKKDGKDRKENGKDGEKDGKDRKESDKADKSSSQKGSDGKKGKDGGRRPQRNARDQRDKETEKENKPKDGPIKDKKDQEKDGSRSEKSKSQSPPERSQSAPPPDLRPLANVLKWIVGAIAAVVVLFILIRALLRFLANFTTWARKLLASFRAAWDKLLAWLRGGSSAAEPDSPESEEPAPRPFADFVDPFLSGAADRMTNERLVRYCFEALQAWALERDLGRQTGETPLEFAWRIGEETPALEVPARKLATFYAQAAYARGTLNKSCREPLRQFWRVLAEVVEKPMSAGVGES